MINNDDPTKWVETFDFTGDTLPEGWGFMTYTPDENGGTVSIDEDELSKHPELAEHKDRLIGRFWNRNIYTITITGKK